MPGPILDTAQMDPMQATFDRIWQKVKTDGVYVVRPYQTIGGMWTVDTWAFPNVPGLTVLMMDEGYTHAIVANGLTVYSTYNKPLDYKVGDVPDLVLLEEDVFQ